MPVLGEEGIEASLNSATSLGGTWAGVGVWGDWYGVWGLDLGCGVKSNKGNVHTKSFTLVDCQIVVHPTSKVLQRTYFIFLT